MASALACRADVAMLPTWLPEDQRFEVEGTSNELAQVDRTLALMRDSFHPRLRAMMPEENVGPTLQWIAHVSLPGAATNEIVYFNSFAKPLSAVDFNLNLLTNRAARLSFLPPTVKISLIFDNPRRDGLTRPLPGIDYPGIAYEDEGSTDRAIRLTLRAPKKKRIFNVRLQAWPRAYREVEFKCVMMPRSVAQVWSWGPDKKNLAEEKKINITYNAIKPKERVLIAFFARDTGKPIWGLPGLVYLSSDDLGRHDYDRQGLIRHIDYGAFRDIYKLDGQGNIIGFSRILSGMVRGDDYSNKGELIVETYPDDKPKITRKVKYAVVDGKLTYEVLDGDIHYKNETMEFRNY